MTTLHLKKFRSYCRFRNTLSFYHQSIDWPARVGKKLCAQSAFSLYMVGKIIMSGRPNAHYDYTHYNRFVKELKTIIGLMIIIFSENTEIIYDSDFISIKADRSASKMPP